MHQLSRVKLLTIKLALRVQVTWDDFRLVPQSAFSPWQIHPVLGAPLPTANGSSPFSASNAQGRERTPDHPAQIPVSLQTESPCNSESAVSGASGGEATFTADRALSTEGPKAGSRRRRETGAESTVGCHKRKRHAAGEGVAARRFVKTRRPRAIPQPEMLPSNLGRSLESALGAIWASSGGKDGGFGSTFLGGTLEAGSFSTSCMSEAAKPAGLGHKPIGLDTVSGTEPASPGPETGGLRPEAGGLSPETGGLRASSAGVGTSALCSDAEPAGFGSSFEFSFKDGFGGQGPEDDTASTASSDDVRNAADDEVSKPCHSSGAKSEHAGSHQASQGLFPLKREAANRESIRGVSASLSEPPSSVAETASRNFWEEAKRWRRQVGSVAEMCGESNPPRGFCGEASEPSSSRLGDSPHLVGCQPEAERKGVLNGLYWAFPSWQGWVTERAQL
jgi:hypothetical protein